MTFEVAGLWIESGEVAGFHLRNMAGNAKRCNGVNCRGNFIDEDLRSPSTGPLPPGERVKLGDAFA